VPCRETLRGRCKVAGDRGALGEKFTGKLRGNVVASRVQRGGRPAMDTNFRAAILGSVLLRGLHGRACGPGWPAAGIGISYGRDAATALAERIGP